VLVVSNRPGVPALERAERAGVPSATFALRDYADRSTAHAAMATAIAAAGARLVVLAGFDHILAPAFFVGLPGVPVINLHPALLPFFGGRGMHGERVHEAVLASGATESGCTVHRVHPETVDLGEVVVQRRVPILPGDDAAALAARVLEEEHIAIVEGIRRVALEGASAR
jgi:phosphoribosylglycinamide formyltransferase-1